MYKTSLSLSILCCIRNSPKRTPRIQFKLRRTDLTIGRKCVFNGLWIATGHLRAVSRTLFDKNHFNRARQNGWLTVQGTITMHNVPYDMHPEIVPPQLSIPIFRVFVLENEYVLYSLFPPWLGNGIIMFLTYELITPLNCYFSCSHFDPNIGVMRSISNVYYLGINKWGNDYL